MPRQLDGARLALSHYVCPGDVSVAQFLEIARDVGAGAVGLTVRALDEAGVAGLKAMLDDAGLAVSSLNSAGYFTYTDAERIGAQERRNHELIAAAAALDAGVLCVITGGVGLGDLSLDAARGRIAEGFAGLAEQARAAGVRLGLEPIHPADIMAKGCVNSIADALAMTTDMPGVDLVLDLYHSWWDPDLAAAFESHLPRVALFQICNLVQPGPEAPLEREVLSAGELDVAGLVRRAEAAGYAGWYEFELFAAQLRGRTVEAVLENAAAAFGSLFASPAPD